MTSLRRARVICAADLGIPRPLVEATSSDLEGRRWSRVTREELEARDRAAQTVREARERAEEIVALADREARDAVDRSRLEAAAQQEATLAARWIALAKSQSVALDAAADRIIAVAIALAERLLGTTLALEPSRIADLARTVLDEARGARRIVLHANPLDAAALRTHLVGAGFEPCSTEIREDPSLGRGDLRLQTDVGNIDAHLAPRLDRLACALRSTAPSP